MMMTVAPPLFINIFISRWGWETKIDKNNFVWPSSLSPSLCLSKKVVGIRRGVVQLVRVPRRRIWYIIEKRKDQNSSYSTLIYIFAIFKNQNVLRRGIADHDNPHRI